MDRAVKEVQIEMTLKEAKTDNVSPYDHQQKDSSHPWRNKRA